MLILPIAMPMKAGPGGKWSHFHWLLITFSYFKSLSGAEGMAPSVKGVLCQPEDPSWSLRIHVEEPEVGASICDP